MNFNFFVSFPDSYNVDREEIFNIRTSMVATANNRRTFNIIYLNCLQNNIRKTK